MLAGERLLQSSCAYRCIYCAGTAANKFVSIEYAICADEFDINTRVIVSSSSKKFGFKRQCEFLCLGCNLLDVARDFVLHLLPV